MGGVVKVNNSRVPPDGGIAWKRQTRRITHGGVVFATLVAPSTYNQLNKSNDVLSIVLALEAAFQTIIPPSHAAPGTLAGTQPSLLDHHRSRFCTYLPVRRSLGLGRILGGRP